MKGVNISKMKEVHTVSVESENVDKESSRIIKNLTVLGLSFTLIFTAYQALANLQSSLLSEVSEKIFFVTMNYLLRMCFQESLGVYSLATVYVFFIISSLFLPPYFLGRLKVKGTLIASISGYIIYIAAQNYPTFGLIIPASAVIGLCAAPLWSAQGAYLTTVSQLIHPTYKVSIVI